MAQCHLFEIANNDRKLTMRLKRAIDHPQIAVGDVQEAIEKYRKLGFSMSPRMFHSMGTSNSIVVFERDYMELIGDFDSIRDAELAAKMRPSFGKDGIAFLGLYTDGIYEDISEIERAGLRPEPIRRYSRSVDLPSGEQDLVEFSVSGVFNNEARAISMFLCEQHRPELVWVDEWMRHKNTVYRIIGITYVADNPLLHRQYLEKVVGQRASVVDEHQILIPTRGGGHIEVLTPFLLKTRFPRFDLDVVGAKSNRGIALRFQIGSRSKLEEVLARNEVSYEVDVDGNVVVGPDFTCGVVMEFFL